MIVTNLLFTATIVSTYTTISTNIIVSTKTTIYTNTEVPTNIIMSIYIIEITNTSIYSTLGRNYLLCSIGIFLNSILNQRKYS